MRKAGGEGGEVCEEGGVSSAATDLDQKCLLQNQSQRHQYFIIGEPVGRCTRTPSCNLPNSLPFQSWARVL